MIITGEDLKRYAEQIFRTERLTGKQIGSSSIDVRLGNRFRVGGPESSIELDEYGKPVYKNFREEVYRYGERILLLPGHLYIAHSMEYVYMPEDVGAILIMRSSSGRRGLDHAHSGWLEPGWHGQITFELIPAVKTEYVVGERIAQLVFFKATTESKYDGQYNGQLGPTLAGGGRIVR